MQTFPQPFTAEEERQAFAAYKSGDNNARNALIEHNLRLVAHIVKKYQNSDEEMEDLLSIGTIGLMKAITTFDAQKGRLATYAARCIENAILSQMRLWFRINPPKVEKNPNGVFWHRLRRIYTSFVPPRTVM